MSKSKEFISNKVVRVIVATAALATAAPHFEANAQVNEKPIIDCENIEGRNRNTASLPILSGQDLVIGEAPRQLRLKAEEYGVHVSRVNDGEEKHLFIAAPQDQGKSSYEVSVREGTINFRPQGQAASIDVAIKREDANSFRADIEASCSYPIISIKDGLRSETGRPARTK